MGLKMQKQNHTGLKYRSFQETVMSALGHLAFAADDLPALLDQVLILIEQTIGVDCCAFFEKETAKETLVLRAGRGWKDQCRGNVRIAADQTNAIGYAFKTGRTVLVGEVATNFRSDCALLEEHAITSGINVGVSGRSKSFGILGAYAKTKRAFAEDEIHFLMGAAKVLAGAIEQTCNEGHREKLASFIRFNPNPVMELAGDATLSYFNDAANELAVANGCSGPGELLPPNIAEIVRSCLGIRKGPVRLETTCHGRIISWALHPVLPDQVVHVYLEDITEQRNLEAQFRQAQKMESIGQLAAGIAHDFNNLLTVIQGNAGILLAQKLLPAKAVSASQAIDFAADRAAGLTRQLLMLSRKNVVELKPLDLRNTIGQLGKMLRRFLGESISLEISIEPEPRLIIADAGMVEQVIMNLAVNARDAMPNGGVLKISVESVVVDERHVQLHAEARAGNFVRVCVADSGCGMDAHTLAHIFEPFFTTKETGKGTGLGLATAFGIIKQHDGWIEVVSEVGKGTSFFLFFAASQHIAAQGPGETPAPAPHPGGNETILLVEDEELLRDMVEIVLSEHGYRIIKAKSGREALQLWKSHQDSIDLLLTDMVMPGGITGTDLAAEMQAVKPNLKIVFMSGYNPNDTLRAGFSPGSSMFLPKPYTGESLTATVRRCLNGSASPATGLPGPPVEFSLLDD